MLSRQEPKPVSEGPIQIRNRKNILIISVSCNFAVILLVGETPTLLELRLCQPRAAASADFKTVGLTRCGPPTCRHRREEEIEPRITRTDVKVR